MIRPMHLILLFVYCSLLACGKIKTSEEIGVISHNRFTIPLPDSNCDIKYTKNIDSEYALIECTDWSIAIDYGFCIYSPYHAYSKLDYLRQKRWVAEDVLPMFLKPGNSASLDTIMKKIHIQSINDSLVASIEYEDSIFNFQIKIPPSLENLYIENDTTSSLITRLIGSPENKNEMTYYMLNYENQNRDCPETLIIRIQSQHAIALSSAKSFFNSIQFPLGKNN